MSAELPSLARRVALGGGLAAALGGAIAATVAGATARTLVDGHESLLLRAAALDLAEEVDEEIEEDREEDLVRPLEQVLLHELEDVRMPGARAAIDGSSGRLAGDARLPALTAGTCSARDEGALVQRICSVAMREGVLVLAVSDPSAPARAQLLGWATSIGALIGAVVGALLSALLSRWALSPLRSLRDRVRLVDAEDPDSAVLAERTSHAELEELRIALFDLVDRLGGALVASRRFAGEAAHELRTPLTTIAVELELLVEGEGDGSLDRESIDRVRARVARLTELVQRLLVLARPDPVDARGAEAVDLGDALEDALTTLALDAPSRVRTRVAEDVLVRGDPSLLTALLSNAIGNALKFSEAPVDVVVSASGDDCVIDVVDQGPGIAPDERDRVFTPFYRSARARAEAPEGHGIGLALIQHVSAAHGGAARFLETERGAHLQIRLPRWSVGRSDAQPQRSSES